MPAVIFLNDRYIEAGKKETEALSPGVIVGKGVFETILVCEGRPVFFQEHRDRMERGLRRFHLAHRFHPRKILRAITHLLRKNGISEGSARIMIWKDPCRVNVSIVCRQQKIFWDWERKKKAKVKVSSIIRQKTRYSHLKTIDYQCLREAYLDAQATGFDEAILLNARKQVVEASRSNVFLVVQGVLMTPSIQSGCLNGIVRKKVLRLASDLGIRTQARLISVNDFKVAEEIFLTNSVLGIQPVDCLDDQKIVPQGQKGITRQLQEAYKCHVLQWLEEKNY